jgi:hypothetical protein
MVDDHLIDTLESDAFGVGVGEGSRDANLQDC